MGKYADWENIHLKEIEEIEEYCIRIRGIFYIFLLPKSKGRLTERREADYSPLTHDDQLKRV